MVSLLCLLPVQYSSDSGDVEVAAASSGSHIDTHRQSALVALLCFLPTGIISLCYSFQVGSLHHAQEASTGPQQNSISCQTSVLLYWMHLLTVYVEIFAVD